jgi:hypothetical protein
MSDNSVIGAIVIIVAGAAAAGFGGYMWMEQGERIDSYESTEATVLSSEVDVETRNDPDDSGTERTYVPEVTYEYTVDGETYESENVFPGPGESSAGQDRAETIVGNHPEGETVTAYYDPDNPSNSFLIKNQQIMFLGIAGFGGLFVLAGLGSLGKRLLGLAM